MHGTSGLRPDVPSGRPAIRFPSSAWSHLRPEPGRPKLGPVSGYFGDRATEYHRLMFRPMEWLQLVVGTVFIPTGLLFLIGGIAVMGERDEPWWIDAMLVAALGALPLVLGLSLWVRVLRAARRRRGEATERKVLGLAAKRDGRLSVQALAYETDLTLREATKILRTMHVDGHCTADVEEDGEMTYVFNV